jgi:hypothetical protein
MALEIVWTAGAEGDLAEVHQHLFFASGENDEAVSQWLEAPLELNLCLLREHPEIAPRVRGMPGIRRRLLGHNRAEKRGIIIHALLDLRQDPATIAKRLRRI